MIYNFSNIATILNGQIMVQQNNLAITEKMATTADIRNGLCIEHNHDIVKIIDFQRFQVGRGSGKTWFKFKSTTSGKVGEQELRGPHHDDGQQERQGESGDRGCGDSARAR